MSAATPRVETIEELLALPDDGMRHELLNGVHVVTPSPVLRHQRFLEGLAHILKLALQDRQDLEVLRSPADIVLEPRTLVQPDLFVIRQDPNEPAQSWDQVGVPALAVEVLSPSTAARDRGAKRKIYQRVGVEEYWIADLDAQIIERWKPDDARPEIVGDELRWVPDEGVSISVPVDQLMGGWHKPTP